VGLLVALVGGVLASRRLRAIRAKVGASQELNMTSAAVLAALKDLLRRQ
jgi:hypothetical protein